MKIYLLLISFLLSLSQCGDSGEKREKEVIPVESDNGIGDGAPALDSLLQNANDSIR